MRFRLWKKAWLIGLMGLILVSAAVGVMWLRLPLVAERQVTERLVAMGFEEPNLRVRSVGFHQLEVVKLSMVHGPWRIQLEQGTARYRPFELFRPELRSLELAGLRIDLDPRHVVTTAEAVRPEIAGLRLMAAELSARVPLRSLAVPDGVFHVDDGEREATLAFTIQLTNAPASGPLRFQVHGWNEQNDIRIVGAFKSRNGAKLAVDLELTDAVAWLALARFREWPEELAGLRLGSLSTTLELRLPPRQGPVELAGVLPGLQVSTRDGYVVLGATRYDARWGNDGWIGLALDMSEIELRHADLLVSADSAAAALQGLDSLEARFNAVRVSGPDDWNAAGDLLLVASPLDSWRKATGRIELQVRSGEMSEIIVEPFHAQIRGGLDGIEIALKQIIVRHPAFGELELTDVDGRATDPFGRDAVGSLAGQLQVTASPHLVMLEPIAFGIDARREAETTVVEMCLNLTNTPLRGFQLPEGLALSGNATAGMVLHTNRPEWRTHFDLVFSATAFDRVEGVRVLEPRLRLERSATATAQPAVAARFEFEARSILYEGIQVANPRGSGEFLSVMDEDSRRTVQGLMQPWMPDAAWLRGVATLEGAAFAYECQLWKAGEWRIDPELAGEFMLGAVPLRDFELPERLTGGKPVHVTGDIDARGRFRVGPGRAFAWWPEVGLAFDRVRYREYEATDVRLGMEWTDPGVAQIELAHARFFSGQVRAAPFRWDLEADSFELELEFEGVSLEQLARQVPQFAGSIEGALNGHIAIGRDAGEVTVRGGRLELDRDRAGRLQYPADGLLTAGWPPGSDEHRRLSLVEDGLKDLRLEALTVNLYDPEDPGTPVKVRLEGTSVSAHAIVPIRFNLNLIGDLDPLFHLFQRGALEIDPGRVIAPGS